MSVRVLSWDVPLGRGALTRPLHRACTEYGLIITSAPHDLLWESLSCALWGKVVSGAWPASPPHPGRLGLCLGNDYAA